MPILNSIAHLPKRPGIGYAPSNNPFFVDSLGAAWDAWYEAQGLKTKDLAIPEAGPYRGSMTSKRCDRALYYALRETMRPFDMKPPEPDDTVGPGSYYDAYVTALQEWNEKYAASNPPGIAEFWTFWLGQLVHEGLQPVILAAFPGASEAVHDLRSIGFPGSSHSDLEVTVELNGEPVLVEIKSTNGFSFKRQATTFQGPPDGPHYGAVLQALLAAKERGIDKVVVVLVSLEKVGPGMNVASSEAGRFMAEWHYTVSEMEPQIEAERRRVARLIDLIEHDEIPTRELSDPEYPVGAVVQSPTLRNSPWLVQNGDIITDTGTTWMCGYCWQRDRCKADGSGE